jgi:hypothetical protein
LKVLLEPAAATAAAVSAATSAFLHGQQYGKRAKQEDIVDFVAGYQHDLQLGDVKVAAVIKTCLLRYRQWDAS